MFVEEKTWPHQESNLGLLGVNERNKQTASLRGFIDGEYDSVESLLRLFGRSVQAFYMGNFV